MEKDKPSLRKNCHRFAQQAKRHGPVLFGILSILWFVIRVGPRPSRITYPCQQVALTSAGGFLAWLGSVAGISVLVRRVWRTGAGKATVSAFGLMFLMGLWFLFGAPSQPSYAAPWTPTDPPNTPMGDPRGIHPGRVVWSHNPEAALWDGNNGRWWEPANNSQAAVDQIMSSSIRVLTGQSTDAAAWNALFRHFNAQHGKGAIEHQSGELIVVKINQNPARDGIEGNGTPKPNQITGHPNLIISLVRSLTSAGISESDIMIYDASRYIADSIFVPLKAAFPAVRVMQEKGGNGREGAKWSENVVSFPDTPPEQVRMTALATQVVEADYMINMAIMKSHGADIATVCGKNHWGTTPRGRDHYWIKGDRPMGSFSSVVPMMGSKYLGENTVLFMIDTIYSANGSDSGPSRWKMSPFNGHWPSSLFVSQDGVAIDSVAFDFENAEWGLPKNTDNYLHEAALADNPPSGTHYAPNGDGVGLPSLGVHEHWNNVNDKKYSRNLGTGSGIELVYVGPDGQTDTDPDPDTDNEPPVVSFIQPSTTEVSSDIGVIVDATDNDGTIAEVLLYIDDQFVRKEGAEPYEWGTANVNHEDPLLLNLLPGTYELRAEAIDNDGAKAEATVSVTVPGSDPIDSDSVGDSDSDVDGGTDADGGETISAAQDCGCEVVGTRKFPRSLHDSFWRLLERLR